LQTFIVNNTKITDEVKLRGLKVNYSVDVVLSKQGCIDTVMVKQCNFASTHDFPYIESEIFRILTLVEGKNYWKPRRIYGKLAIDTIPLNISYFIPMKSEIGSNQYNFFKSELESWSINQALKLIDEGNYEKAVPTISKAIELNPENQEAYLMRGNCYIFLDRIPEACIDFHKIRCTGRVEVEEFIQSYCMP
jgi:tetratricopeptide (TPR) repeat protein